MPFAFTMPKLSPTMDEGVIAKWHKKEGDHVEAGDLLLEITTDKATVEHNALDEGWLRKIVIQEGALAKVNQPIAIFSEKKDENIEDFLAKQMPKKEEIKKQPKPEEKKEEAKKVSDAAPFSQPTFVPESPLTDYVFPFPDEREPFLRASPLAKKQAKEKGMDLSTVKGTGPGGRVTSEDLDLAQTERLVTFGTRKKPESAPGTYEEISLSPMRKTIGKRLQESKTFIPHFYIKQIIGVDALVQTRTQLQNLDLKITYNDFIIRAAALALKKHPEINSGFNSVNQTIIRFKTVDISVAVTIKEGLITPIIRHADYKNLGEIAIEARQLAEKAKNGKLKEQEYKGGSFCISNLGMYGISEFMAVINPPQAAILAVGGIETHPVIKEGSIQVGKTMTLILSADHRVIDGVAAAQFIKTLQFLLENPAALLIG